MQETVHRDFSVSRYIVFKSLYYHEHLLVAIGVDINAALAMLNTPYGLAVSPLTQHVYIGDSNNYCIRRVDENKVSLV